MAMSDANHVIDCVNLQQMHTGYGLLLSLVAVVSSFQPRPLSTSSWQEVKGEGKNTWDYSSRFFWKGS